jgi:hypothetical protein
MLPAHNSVPVGLRELFLCAVFLSAATAAEPAPESVRSCAALTDSAERLACYDREAARASKPANDPGQASGEPAAATEGPAASAPAPSPPATQDVPAAQDVPESDEHKGGHEAPVTRGSFTARVTRIKHAQVGMLLYLDNGQVWQELQAVAGDLSLRPGDTVEIEKHLGSFYLTGPHVYGMSVRQK